jgi:hypothetical protein
VYPRDNIDNLNLNIYYLVNTLSRGLGPYHRDLYSGPVRCDPPGMSHIPHLDNDTQGVVTKDQLDDSLPLAAHQVCEIATKKADGYTQGVIDEASALCAEWETLPKDHPQSPDEKKKRDAHRSSLKRRMTTFLKTIGEGVSTR